MNRGVVMTPSEYEGWYHTPRGKWIGDVEFRLVRKLLQPIPGATLLDVGCGTGYFTRRLAAECSLDVVGLDPNVEWLAFARLHAAGNEVYCGGRAEQLPFADGSFDYAISITALCFVDDARRAVQELLRVSRRRFVIGLLHRHSALFRQKGRGGGTGAYRGAHWHTVEEIEALLRGLPVANATIRTAIFLPSGTSFARSLEMVVPSAILGGGFIAVAGDIARRL